MQLEFAAQCQEHISILGIITLILSVFSLSHAMTVLLECLTVLLQNLDLFEIFSWFDIMLSLTADLQGLNYFQCLHIH